MPDSTNDEQLREQVTRMIIENKNEYDGEDVDFDGVVRDTIALIHQHTEQAVLERTKLIKDKFTKLESGIFAIKPVLDKPYLDDPRWTPYSRFIHPREIMVRKALEGEDVGELWAMGEIARQEQLTTNHKGDEL